MCTRPLKFWPSMSKNEDTGKIKGIITSYGVTCVTPLLFQKKGLMATPLHCKYVEPIEVPCGKCPECRKAFKYRWLGRCLAEMETTKFAYFLTLTYDDFNVVKEPIKEHVQNFINRLRKYIRFRYIAVGEKGTLSERSHYHLILFSEDPIKDLKFFKLKGGNKYYISELISHCWDEKGHIVVSRANGPTIAYTLGYLLTKEKNTCFKLQSQGLGREFFSSLRRRYILGNGRGQSVHVALPRYLKEKYGLEFEYDPLKQELLWKNRVTSSSLSDEEYRSFAEYIDEHKLVIH